MRNLTKQQIHSYAIHLCNQFTARPNDIQTIIDRYREGTAVPLHYMDRVIEQAQLLYHNSQIAPTTLEEGGQLFRQLRQADSDEIQDVMRRVNTLAANTAREVETMTETYQHDDFFGALCAALADVLQPGDRPSSGR